MEIFWTDRIEAGLCLLGEEESAHCVRVLRHREGDNVCVIDGVGTMYECVLSQASPKAAVARIEKANPGWGSHPYRLEMAVCPTKNIDRYEWFVEKATEVGADRFVPVIGEHSERKVLKTERLRRIVLSAAKQSLKAAVPEIAEPLTVKEFIASVADSPALKMIACCFEDESHPRTSVMQALSDTDRRDGHGQAGIHCPDRSGRRFFQGRGKACDRGGIHSRPFGRIPSPYRDCSPGGGVRCLL